MIVETRNLVVRYPRRMFRRGYEALAGVDLQVGEGSFFALLGPNGAGKSTAMHCMLGLLRPTSGDVRVLGIRPEPGAAAFRELAYLPEEPRYPEYLTVREAVTYYAELSGVRPSAGKVDGMLERLDLAQHRSLPVRKCSKGMKQKVGIAQCLIHEPRLIFLDEPMRGLDPMTVHLFRGILTEMNRNGATIVMSSHLLSEVELVADRVAILQHGRLIAQDTVRALLSSPSPDYTVEIDLVESPPEHLEQPTVVDGRLQGTVRRGALYAFMDEARRRDLHIVKCELTRTRLEDRVLTLLQENTRHA